MMMSDEVIKLYASADGGIDDDSLDHEFENEVDEEEEVMVTS